MIDKTVTSTNKKGDLKKSWNVKALALSQLQNELKSLEPEMKAELEANQAKYRDQQLQEKKLTGPKRFSFAQEAEEKEAEKDAVERKRDEEKALAQAELHKQRLLKMRDYFGDSSNAISEMLLNWRHSLSNDDQVTHPMVYWNTAGHKWPIIRNLAMKYLVLR
jgi:hypothetical protein